MPGVGFTVIDEAMTLAEELKAAGAEARIMGGVAVALHCPPFAHGQRAHRDIEDIDFFLASRRDAGTMTDVLDRHGYAPDAPFNALNGRERLIFHGSHWKVDVFVKGFAMCHVIPLADRVAADWPTISVTDLLLTKLQVVEFTDKDRSDVERLLSTHALAEEEGDVINVTRLVDLVSSDWGLWRTLTGNLTALQPSTPTLSANVEELLKAIDARPKTLAFRIRAKVGDKKRWYAEPEESER